MNAGLQIVFYIIVIIIVFLVGMPFTFAFLSDKTKNVFIPLSLLNGAAILIICSFYFSYVCNKEMVSFSRQILALFIIIAIIFLAVKRKEFLLLIKNDKSNYCKVLLCIVGGGIALLPSVVFNGGFTYVDTYTYVSIADILQDIGYGEIIENDIYFPYLTQINLYQTQGYRIGAQMLLAFYSAVFQREFSLELYAPLSALGIILCGCGAWLFVELNYKVNRLTSFLAVLLTVFNIPILSWCAIYGFFPQVYGLAYFIASYGIFIYIIRAKNHYRKGIFFINGIFIATVGFTYNEVFPFLILVFGLFFLSYCLYEKKISVIFKAIKDILVVGIFAILLLVPYFGNMVKAILSQMKTSGAVGWEVSGGIWSFIGHIFSTVPADFYYESSIYNMYDKLIYSSFTLIMLVLLILGVGLLLRSKSYEILADAVVSLVPFVALFVFFTYIVRNPFNEGYGNKWSAYKVVQYSITIILPYAAVFLSYTYELKILRRILGCICVIFVLSNIKNGLVYANVSVEPIRQLTGNFENPIGEYYKLYDNFKNEENVINILGAPDTHRKLSTYFLQKNRLISNWGTDSYFYIYHDKVPIYDESGIILHYNPMSTNKVANYEVLDTFPIDIEFSEEFYQQETTESDNWNWCSERIGSIYFNKYLKEDKRKITFEIAGVTEKPANVRIYDGAGNVLKEVQISGDKREYVELEGDIESLKFEYFGETLNTESERCITFSIWNISAY